MFKLVTGSPGDGKTSNELWDFLHSPEYNGRPKYCTPIKGFEPDKHGVTPIAHLSEWESLPEGSVVFCDEVQDYCGTDISAKAPPEWVKNFAKHRHHGFDFICTTQSPMFLHPFARKLAKPHVHYIRPWNLKGVRYSWETVQGDPTTKSAKAMGIRTPVTPNPEVFKLYTSTVLDTHKSRPPYKVFALLAFCVLLFIVGGFFAISRIWGMNHSAKKPDEVATTLPDHSGVPLSAVNNVAMTSTAPVWTAETTKPRIEGLAYTAPVYDQLTQPTDFPRVAACMSSERTGCKCYSQQATPLDIPKSACMVYVAVGSFDPWLSGRKSQGQQAPVLPEQSPMPAQTMATAEQSGSALKVTVIPDTSRLPRSSPPVASTSGKQSL